MGFPVVLPTRISKAGLPISFFYLFQKDDDTAGKMILLFTSYEGSAKKDPWSVFI